MTATKTKTKAKEATMTTTTTVEEQYAEIQARKEREAESEQQAYQARMARADEKSRDDAIAGKQRRVARTGRFVDALVDCQTRLADLKPEERGQEGGALLYKVGEVLSSARRVHEAAKEDLAELVEKHRKMKAKMQ